MVGNHIALCIADHIVVSERSEDVRSFTSPTSEFKTLSKESCLAEQDYLTIPYHGIVSPWMIVSKSEMCAWPFFMAMMR